MEKSGIFVSLEGIDGSGKSSQTDFVAELFAGYGYEVVTTREPGGTHVGESLRQLLLAHTMSIDTELLLMFAARKESFDQIIKPNLARNAVVISDRFTDSSLAYQGGGRQFDKERIKQLIDWIHPGVKPDLTLLFDLDYCVAKSRRTKYAASNAFADRFEMEKQEFYNRVRHCYLKLAELDPERFVVLDSSQPLETVQSQISQGIRAFMSKRGILRDMD